MKKVLLVLACLPCTAMGMDNEPSAQSLDKFITMEHKHMNDWLNYKKAKYDATIELMKNHLSSLIDLKRKGLAELDKGTDIKAYFGQGLKKWISMHEDQTKEWKEFHEAQHKAARDLADSHKKELNSFKEMLQPKVAEVKKEQAQPEELPSK